MVLLLCNCSNPHGGVRLPSFPRSEILVNLHTESENISLRFLQKLLIWTSVVSLKKLLVPVRLIHCCSLFMQGLQRWNLPPPWHPLSLHSLITFSSMGGSDSAACFSSKLDAPSAQDLNRLFHTLGIRMSKLNFRNPWTMCPRYSVKTSLNPHPLFYNIVCSCISGQILISNLSFRKRYVCLSLDRC